MHSQGIFCAMSRMVVTMSRHRFYQDRWMQLHTLLSEKANNVILSVQVLTPV
jgi:hypothetical protein